MASLFFGVALVIVFSDQSRTGQAGIALACLAWCALIIWGIINCFWGARINGLFALRALKRRPSPADGAIIVDARTPDPIVELAATPLRRL
jgi:hypothetical protein